MEEEWKAQFNAWCDEKFIRIKNTSSALTEASIQDILTYLKEDRLPVDFDRQQKANFKFKVGLTFISGPRPHNVI